MQNNKLEDLLSAASQTTVHSNYSMAQECSFACGGFARFFCAPADADAFQALLKCCHQEALPFVIIGGGANLLFRDEGFPGVVISTKNLNHIRMLAPGKVAVGAGLANRTLTAYTLEHHLAGFEWAAGLPGSIGGGIFMNAKCYGRSFSDITVEVTAVAADGKALILSKDDCDFRYKHSLFQTHPYFITEAVLALTPGNPDEIKKTTKANHADRVNKHQFQYPSAGCIYKNNYALGTPTGALIDACGFKGRQIGGIKVFEHHANFLVNLGHGRTQDVLDLMAMIEAEVWKKHKVRLEPEIHIVPKH